MHFEEHSTEWGKDRLELSVDSQVLTRLAELLDVPTPPQSSWRAATVTMFATNPLGVTSAYHQHVQDLNWPLPEATLITQAIQLLQHRAKHSNSVE